ncbi:MAG: glycosyltransferase family 2 protein, partial [Proteobacteria bacterium]|nr:glycosyltransferase family 2 protein [Pseudomonadota bacterium]
MPGEKTPVSVSFIIPCRNEEGSIGPLIDGIRRVMESREESWEILVVDDASTDSTGKNARSAGARVITHPYNIGNGASVKTGIRAAQGEIVVMMDGDGQHSPEAIPQFLEALEDHDMAVGARTASSHAGVHRLLANTIYNWLASYVSKRKILDLTSGFRATRKAIAMRHLYLLPNTFSYPTTITMSYLRSGLTIKYVPIEAAKRSGQSRSKIRPFIDGTRFFLIITRVATIYSPFRVFLPVSAFLFLVGCIYYIYTFTTIHRFTNMSMLLFVSSLIIFMLGIVSEQISQI